MISGVGSPRPQRWSAWPTAEKLGVQGDLALPRQANVREPAAVAMLAESVAGVILGAVGAAPPAPKVGDTAPALALTHLDGRPLDLAATDGSGRALLFWNPGCGFCQQMLPELQAWDANPPAGAPELVVVTTGSEEEGRGMGLRSTVVTDPHSRAPRAFGAGGTPMGVLLDEHGRIASAVAAGAEAVMALLNRRDEAGSRRR